jgi:hypothetical protein
MKKITELDVRVLDMGGKNDKPDEMPTRRELLRLFGNQKAETADEARRARRIISKVRDKALTELVLENDDMAFLMKVYEKNAMNLPAWMHGQVLDIIDAAEKVDLPLKA